MCCASGLHADRRYVRQVAGQGVRAEVRSDDADLRDNILRFYSDLSVSINTKKDSVRWQGVLTALDQLMLVAPVPTVASGSEE